MQRIIPHSNVKQFKYLKVLTQEFHVKVDLLFINEIAEMFTDELTDEEKVSGMSSQALNANQSQVIWYIILAIFHVVFFVSA